MIRWGKLLFERRLISGWGGNLSCRVGKNDFLITGQHAPLGFLDRRKIWCSIDSGRQAGQEKPARFERNADAFGGLCRHGRAGDRPCAPADGSGVFA